ncbi:MAG: hypothetical protein J2P24_00265 [Streptosporangiales bacterium]|nr:hypothetical protein [Streptosporangiales bacterium]
MIKYLVAAMLTAFTVAGGAAVHERHVQASEPADPPAVTKVVSAQTWPLAYVDTPCTAWGSRMDEDQRWMAALQLLAGLRLDAAEHMRPHTVDLFEQDVADQCAVNGFSVAEAAYAVFHADSHYATA